MDSLPRPGRSSGAASRAITHRPRRPARPTAAAIAVCLVLASVGALAGSWLADDGGDDVRTAETLVLLRPLQGNAFNPDGAGSDLVNMETEAQLVQSALVTRLAAESLGAPDQAGEIRRGTTSTVPPNTQLVQITASGEDGDQAEERAQALAETFLAYRAERAESFVADVNQELRGRVQRLEERRRGIIGRLGRAGPERPVTLVREQRIDEITTQLGELRVQRAELQAASEDPGQVVTDADAAEPGLLTQVWLFPALGALAGLALGLVLVGGRRRLDERVHGPEDLAHVGVPVLGRLPSSTEDRSAALGGVRAAVLASEPYRPLVLGVAVGSAGDREEGLAATRGLASELGLSLRRAGLSVAVLDLASGAEAYPEVSTVALDSDPLLPLSALLDLEQDLADVLARRRASGLPLAVVNDIGRDDLVDRASSPEMEELLAALRGVADVVVADLGSLDDVSTQALVGAVDAVILTVGEGGATFGELEHSLQRTPLWGGRVAGLVSVAAEDRTGRRRAPFVRRSGRAGQGAGDEPTPPRQGGGPAGGRASTLVAEGPR